VESLGSTVLQISGAAMSILSSKASPAGDIVSCDMIVQGAHGPLSARLYRTREPATKRDTLVVFFHGGGFVRGTIDETDDFLFQLIGACPGVTALSASYSLAPARPFPAAVEDAHAVLLWATKHKAKLSWNGNRLIVAGIEAGANLAAVASLMARDRSGPRLEGQVLIMPMLDPGLTSCSMRAMPNRADRAAIVEQVTDLCAANYRAYLPHAVDRTHPYAAPLQTSRLKNLPSALILSAEDDPLCDEAEQYGARLIQAGVTVYSKRLPAPSLREHGGRTACVCSFALAEIASFMMPYPEKYIQERTDG
jgi:acetyl esterase